MASCLGYGASALKESLGCTANECPGIADDELDYAPDSLEESAVTL